MLLMVLNIIFCIAFIGFAWVNLNDKDAWKWVPIYMVAAILCGLAAFKYYYPTISIIAICVYLIYAVVLFFVKDGVWDWLTKYKRAHIAQSMQATKPYIEKTREFFGLLIISAALFVNLF
ncbi:MAG: transmembrane 220 family protein [Chitinophagaceae bacterium]|nr:transmembrane 220 family protein [Chitinophagaceae bacterium]